ARDRHRISRSSPSCRKATARAGEARRGYGSANEKWPPLTGGLRNIGRCGPIGPAGSVMFALQSTQLRIATGEVVAQVCDLLVGQALGLHRHQRMFAGAITVGPQRVREVVAELAAQLGVGRVDRAVAVGTVAVDARLA